MSSDHALRCAWVECAIRGVVADEHGMAGPFAPVQVCDQSIYNAIEQAELWLLRLFEQMSAWLRTHLIPWEDRCLAPWASAIYAVDASTLDRLGRSLP